MDFFNNTLVPFFLWLWGMDQVRVIVAHTTLNVVVAVAASIYMGEFKLYKVVEFLYRKLAPFLLVFAFAKGLGEAAGMGWLETAAFGVIEATLVSDLAENLAGLGVKWPDGFLRLVTKTPPKG